MSDNALRSWRNTPIYPIGINIVEKEGTKVKKIKVIAIHGRDINAFFIERKETTDSPYGYAASSMYETTKISYELGTRAYHDLLSVRNNEKAMHYKYESPMQTEDAYELFNRIISSLRKDNFKECPENFVASCEYNGKIINLMVDSKTREKKNMDYLLETEKSHVDVHPDNLSEAKLVLIENLRQYKIWEKQ